MVSKHAKMNYFLNLYRAIVLVKIDRLEAPRDERTLTAVSTC